MIDIGTAPGSSNVAKIIVHPDYPNALVIVGADKGPGTSEGPSRNVLIFEDLTLRGNLDAGLIRAVKITFHDAGTITSETPRIGTEVSPNELSIIGAGPNNIPNTRSVKVYDNLEVAHNMNVGGVIVCAGIIASTLSLNVKDFGATGDGTTDDTAAIQSALDAIEITGGELFFPVGTYHINAGRLLYISSQPITLSGTGWKSKILWTQPPSVDPGNYDYGMLNMHGPTDEYEDHTQQIVIRNLAFDFGGGRDAGHSEYRRGINIYAADNIFIERCFITKTTGEGIGISNFGVNPSTLLYCRRTTIKDCFFLDGAQDFINPNGYYTLIHNCYFEEGTNPIEAGRSYLTITDCEFRDSTSVAIKVASVFNFNISGNRFYECAYDGTGLVSPAGVIAISGQGSNDPSADGVISNNVIYNSTNHAWHVGISTARGTATSTTTRITIQGNSIYGAKNGIYIADLANSAIQGNQFFPNSSSTALTIANTIYNENIYVFNNYAPGTWSYATFLDQTSGQGNLITGNYP